jgi:hypothetical protein
MRTANHPRIDPGAQPLRLQSPPGIALLRQAQGIVTSRILTNADYESDKST